MPREETERTSNAHDQDGKLEVDNILFIVVTVSIVTVTKLRTDIKTWDAVSLVCLVCLP